MRDVTPAAVDSDERSIYHFIHVHQMLVARDAMSVPAFSQMPSGAPGSTTHANALPAASCCNLRLSLSRWPWCPVTAVELSTRSGRPTDVDEVPWPRAKIRESPLRRWSFAANGFPMCLQPRLYGTI